MKAIAGRLHFELFLGLFMRGAGAVTGFALSWLIAHYYGARTIGLYQIGLVTANMVSLAAGLGLDNVLIREVSIAFRRNENGRALQLYQISLRRVLIAGAVMSLAIIVFAHLLAVDLMGAAAATIHIQILAPVLLLTAIIRLTSSMLRARGHVLASQSLDGLAYSGLASIFLAVLILAGFPQDPRLPAVSYLIGTGIVTVAGLYMVHRITRHWSPQDAILPAAPGLRIAAVNVITQFNNWIGMVLLTSQHGPESAGIFRIAFQYCMLFQLVNSSFSIMVGPHLAKAGSEGNKAEMMKILGTATKLGTLLALPLLLFLLFFPNFALGLFGQQFKEGAATLQVIAVSQFVNVLAGPLGAALTMNNQEKTVLHIQIGVIIIGVLTSVVLVPALGMMGVALSILVTSVLTNVFSILALRRHWRRI